MKQNPHLLIQWPDARLALVFLLAAFFNTSAEGQVINANLNCWSSHKPFTSLEYHDSMMYATTKSPAYYRFDMNYNMVVDSIAVGTYYPVIRRFHVGRDGHLYAQTDTFLMRKTPTGWISTGFTPHLHALVTIDNQSNIWTYRTLPQTPPGHEIIRFNGTTAIQYLSPMPISYINWSNIIADDSGAVWIGTIDGLFRFTTTGYSYYFPGQLIADMQLDDQNRLYFACDSVLMIRDINGFSVFNPNISMDAIYSTMRYTTKVYNNTYYVFWNGGWVTPPELEAVTSTGIQNMNLSWMHFCQDSVIRDLCFDPYGRFWLLGMASGDNGHIYVQDSTLLSYITGKVFHDINWNGVYDTGDLPLQNIAVNNIFTSTISYSNSQGDYQISMPGMIGVSYIVNQMVQSPWVITSPTIYSGLLFPSTPATNIDFGYSTNVPPTYLDITAFGAVFQLPPGFPSDVYFYAQNLSTFTVYNVEAWYVHDTIFSSYSCNIPPTISGPDTAYWLIDSLLPLESRVFHITLPLPSSTVIGTPFDLTFYVNHPIDTFATNDTIRLSDIINNSYDPNDKMVHPNRPEKDIAPDELLTYTVRFQNIGTAPAIIVVIRDTLSQYLNLSTLKIIGASHPYTWVLNPGNELEITFANIHLTDSASIPEESVGAISFTIKPLPGLVDGTEITNEAAIYFDFNTPIITGKTQSFIKDPTIGIQKSYRYEVNIWPNPVNDVLFIESPEFRSGEAIRVALFDLQGRMVMETYQYPEENRIPLSTLMLKPGYYFGTCTQANHFPVSFRMVKKP